MNQNNRVQKKKLTNHKPVKPSGAIHKKQVFFLRALIFLGFLSLFNYFSWWLINERIKSPWLLISLGFALLYAGIQLVGNWILYLFARQPRKALPSPEGLTIDVFVTTFNESHELVERALSAACKMRGKHRTWLLDDGNDPLLASMADRYFSGYLTRDSHQNAKAGNLNAAIEQTDGDIIVIFDIDHVPETDFLEKSLGFFTDPEMGFVQVMLTFNNGDESWVAEAAIETSLEYYNPTSFGADGVGGTTLMGSNALIRRSALKSIGGYQPGLAEDLATSINLHAAGWKSSYVPEPLAPGVAPPSFTAWFVQQLKWARGVFELLLTTYPRLFSKLTWGQRLSYSVRMTKYWIGPVIAIHLFATIAILIFAGPEIRAAFHSYLIHITPLALTDVLIRHFAFRFYRHQSSPKTSLARAVALVYSTWPIYTLSWGMALLRIPLGFRPTPKSKGDRLNPVWLFPQGIALILLILGALFSVVVVGHQLSFLLFFAIIQGTLQMIILYRWLYSNESFQFKRTPLSNSDPVAVLDLDFANLPEKISISSEQERALALIRYKSKPVGQVQLVFTGKTMNREILESKILRKAKFPFWQAWTEDKLGLDSNSSTELQNEKTTIAICTRDRPEDLKQCLEGITQIPDDGQEVIVIDSCSQNQQTKEICQRFPEVRYIYENFPGLNRARNRALIEASHEIIAFIDDDAIPDPNWLRWLLPNFHDPRVLCVTGLTMPLELDTSAQQWFERYSPFNRGFNRKVYDKNNLHRLAAGRVGSGVNMAVRKSVLDLIGPFDEILDAGTPTQSGGDTEMFYRIITNGFQIVYDPAALSWHRHRRTWEELRHVLYGYGVGTYAYWTGKLVQDKEWSVFLAAANWFLRYQCPALFRSILHFPNSTPVDLLINELRGCLAGPQAYFASQKQNELLRID
jgi:cellulose synthase/poly-beta-1,6-N-acetylglucosamine synthase-like glycosyltransferase